MADPNQATTIPIDLTAHAEMLRQAMPDHDTSEGKAQIKEVIMEALNCWVDIAETGPALENHRRGIGIAKALLEEF